MLKLGLGLMRLPLLDPDDNSSIDKAKTKEMIDLYMKEGFSYFDTAYVYHGGESEKIFGELVADRYPRDSFVLTTKMPVFNIKEAKEYPEIFDEQLKRCHVEYFDYYFLHAIGKSSYEKIKEHKGFEFLVQKKKEGKIKHIGFSFHDTAEVLDTILIEHPEVELVQLQLNYIDWEDERIQSKKCYEVCLKHDVKIAVMEPLKGGALANLSAESKDILKKANADASIASWGIRFAASLDEIIVVLSGMSNLEQLKDNMSYMKDFKPLSDLEYQTIDKVVKVINDSIKIPCTGCKYCIDDCPKKIAIPEYFSLYNNQNQFGHMVSHSTAFNNITKTHGKPSDCIECKKCEKHCPQHIKITEMLKEISKTFE